ncbi:MAG: hypothetical protein KDA27_11795, partial [Candidatus Eisenbacteria bacterium]|nr:hypothetical protein [Candidatus Eisenbacteria bacterium]
RTARQSVSENELRSTRRKSARALLEIGYVADALTELIDVGDRKSALRLVRRRAVQLLEEGALDGLRPILERLTVTELDSSPEALALIGTSWDYEGDWDRASSFYRRALKGAPRASVRAELLSRLASLEQRRGRNKTAIRLCKSGLRSESRLSSPLRTRLLSTLGIACCDSGRLIHGEEYFNQALEIAARTGSARVSARILFLLAANVHYPRGDFLRAREAAHRSHLLFQELEHSFQVCHSLGVLAFVTMEGGDIDGARPLAHRALRIAKSLEYESVVGYCEYTVGKIDLLSGDRSEARRLFESSLERGGRTGESHLQVLPKLGLAHLDLMEGNVLRARKFGEEALSTAEELQDRLGQIQAHQLLARVEAGRDSIRVRSHWDAAESLAERLGARAELHRVWIDRLLGEGKRDVANDPGTRDRLAGLVRGIAESGHEFLLAQVAEERVESLLSMARQLGVEERYVESLSHRLGRATTAEGAGDPPPRCAPDVDGASPGCEFEIQALGSLRVRVGSRWIERDDWRSARARKLFLSLLAHRFRWVTKPQLIELLWPGADPGRGENSLRQSVHVLRRLLDSPGSERSSFVLVQADACRLDPGPSFRYDVSEFESFVAAGESSWDPDEPGEAESKFRRALELLRGDFVEDSPYEEGLASERERLRELAVRTHLRVIEAASGSGEWAEVVALSRRGLELDPYHEDLHAFVIEGLTQIGHRKEAVLAYQEYESRMSREMRLLPSRRLVALAERAGVLAHPSSRGRDE